MVKFLEFAERGEVPQANIPIAAVDIMFDAPYEVREDLREVAFEKALPRVQALCQPVSPEDAHLADVGVTAISESRQYRTPQGTIADIRLCTRMIGEDESVGVLVGSDKHFSPPTPALELSRLIISADPATTLDNRVRYNQIPDLQSIFNAIQLFDGQAVYIS